MAVEANVRTISDLDKRLPDKSDYISEGDDHLRLIKSALQLTFTQADKPLTSPFSELSKVTDYMKFTTATTTNFPIITFEDNTVLKNIASGVADTDVASVGQVKSLIKAVLSNAIYKVGSYFITDDTGRPEDILDMANTVWERVPGFLAGVGTVGGGVLDKQTVTFANKVRGGAPSVSLTELNLPRVGVDGSGLSTSVDTHSHTTQFDAYRANGNTGDSDGELAGEIGRGSGGDPDHRYTTSAYSHAHNVLGTIYFGHEDSSRTAVSTIPPYYGTNIWRRTA